MWLKLLLLCLYLLAVFLLSRLLEAVSLYNEDHHLFSPKTILDPFALSVRKLKQLLDSRGVSYVGVVEKQELSALLETSGQVTEEDLQDADEEANVLPSTQTVHFTCGSHFYEEVEDTKDSIWLVQVVSEQHPKPLLDKPTWQQAVSKVSRFGVRTGVFECSLDPWLCARKGWTSSRLILALPRGQTAKQDVVIHSYLYPPKTQPVLQWVRQQLASRIHHIHSAKDLKLKWLSPDKSNSLLQVILISTLTESPLFLSALAVKFTGRARFGMLHSNELHSKELRKQLRTAKLPLYLVISPGKVRLYGTEIGEALNYRSMELYLKILRPEMNDVFLLSIFLANAAVGLEIFLVGGKLWRHAIRWFLQLIKVNFVMLLIWLLILGMHQFHFLQTVTDLCLRVLRVAGDSSLSSTVRNDWKRLSPSFFGTTFVGFGLAIGLLWKLLGYGRERDAPLFSDWWSVPWDSYLMNYFFRPMATLTRPIAPSDLDFEQGMELLIERLAMPNLWLQPVVPADYIQNLPIWKYCGWCDADDNRTNCADVVSSSEDEGAVYNFSSSAIPSTSDADQTCRKTSSSKFIQHAKALKESFCCLSRNKKEAKIETNQTTFPRKRIDSRGSENRSPVGMVECRECSVCLENYQYGEPLCGLPCGHNYHLTCIMLWLSRDNHCCPVCRWPPYRPNLKTSPHRHAQ